MAITFKQIASGAKKLVSKAVSGVKNAISSIGNAISGSSNTASALQATLIPGSLQKAQASSNAKVQQDLKTLGAGLAQNNVVPGSNTVVGTSFKNLMSTPGGATPAAVTPQLPVTISAGKLGSLTNYKSGSSNYNYSGSNSNSLGGFGTADYGPIAPATITAQSLSGLSSGGGTSSLSSGGSVGGNSISLSSAPTSVNPRIDNTALAGGFQGLYQRNADGTYTEVKQDKASQTDEEIAKAKKDLYDQILGVEPTVYEDKQVKQAIEQRNQLKEQLQGPTAELNAVIAKQNQDLLQLRNTGSKEGVTEAVYGGQQAQINYEAAIRSLPLQASIAAIQGQLDNATDYLNELTQIKQKQIDNQYSYNKNLFAAIEGALDKKDQRAYDEIKTENERAYQENKSNIADQDEWAKLAIQAGKSNLVKRIHALDSASPTFRQDLGNIISEIKIPQKNTLGSFNGQLSPTAQAIISNPNLLSNLTPTIKGQVITELAQAGYDVTALGAKPLSDTAIKEINQTDTALTSLNDLKAIVEANTDKIGPITGFAALNPYSEARKIQADIDRVKQQVGKALEGGVLRKEDEEKYKKILATITDTPSTATYKIDQLIGNIEKSIEDYKALQTGAGRSANVTGELQKKGETNNDPLEIL